MIGTIGRGVLGLTVQLRALPQPQVRSDLAEGLLPDAGVAVRVRGDGLSAGAEGAGRGVREEDGGDRREDRAAAAADPRSSRSRTGRSWRRRNTRSIRENVQRAIAIPEDKRTPGEALLAGQVIRTTSVSSDEIDRVMTPADLARKRSS